MKRLDYTAFYDDLKAKLGRRPNAPEVIDALLKAGWAGSGYRRVLEGKRVFLEQDEEATATSGVRNVPEGNVPATGNEDPQA